MYEAASCDASKRDIENVIQRCTQRYKSLYDSSHCGCMCGSGQEEEEELKTLCILSTPAGLPRLSGLPTSCWKCTFWKSHCPTAMSSSDLATVHHGFIVLAFLCWRICSTYLFSCNWSAGTSPCPRYDQSPAWDGPLIQTQWSWKTNKRSQPLPLSYCTVPGCSAGTVEKFVGGKWYGIHLKSRRIPHGRAIRAWWYRMGGIGACTPILHGNWF